MNILRCAMQSRQSQVVGLCDVDESQLDKAYTEVNQLNGDQPRLYKDYREMLAKEKPEICIVGTPDHWHALPTIAAVKAGAHVYVEKPICHTQREGRAMVKAARETQRYIQVGTHRRVSPHCISAAEFLRSGKAGKTHYAVAVEGGGAALQIRLNLSQHMAGIIPVLEGKLLVAYGVLGRSLQKSSSYTEWLIGVSLLLGLMWLLSQIGAPKKLGPPVPVSA